jgi:hypothetical protein
MTSYSKKIISSFVRDSMNTVSIVRLFSKDEILTRIQESKSKTDTAININPYTLEEQVIIYPVIVVDNKPECKNIIIDIE